MELLLHQAVVIILLLCLAGACFGGAKRLFPKAEKQVPSTILDSYLPLRGRWLRYAAVWGLTLLGVAAVLVAVVVLSIFAMIALLVVLS
jgi:hypothetical protein